MSDVPSQAGRPEEAGIQLHLGKGEQYRSVEEYIRSPFAEFNYGGERRTEMSAAWPEVIIDKVR